MSSNTHTINVTTPRVAIVTRTKDREITLRRTAQSVMDQTYPHILWVLVNDGGSSAHVNRLADTVRESGWEVLVVHHEESKGRPAAANAGIAANSCPWLLLLDDDDTIAPSFVERCISYLQHSEFPCEGVATWSDIINERIEGNEIVTLKQERGHYPDEVSFITLFYTNTFPPAAFLFSRKGWESAGHFDERLHCSEDWNFNQRFLLSGRIGIIPEVLAFLHHRVEDYYCDSAYENTVVHGADKHHIYYAFWRDELLRKEIQSGMLGLGELNLLALNYFHAQKSHDMLQANLRVLTKANEQMIKANRQMLQENFPKLKETHQMLQGTHQILQGTHQILQGNHQILQENHQMLQANIPLLQANHQWFKENRQILETILPDLLPFLRVTRVLLWPVRFTYSALRKMKKALKQFVSIFASSKTASSHSMQSDDFFCPACGNVFDNFVPLPQKYIQYTEAGGKFTCKDLEMLAVETHHCPKCYSADRDRLSAWYLKSELDKKRGSFVNIMEFAPHPAISVFLKSFSNVRLSTCDLYMEGVDYKYDITNMKEIPDGSYQVIVCSHVLEHVRDDVQAMREMNRILAPGGKALITVPIYIPLDNCYEDFAITEPAERIKHFGQDDHVRLYSRDCFISRLIKAGFSMELLGIADFGEDVFKRLGLTKTSTLYIAHKPQ